LEINDPDFEIKYIVAPTYRIFAEGKTQEECDYKIKKCFDYIFENMKKFGNKVSLSIGEKKNVKEREITIKYKNIR
jgi:translation initiation factor 2 alpha subunit (eIF-2alpha)